MTRRFRIRTFDDCLTFVATVARKVPPGVDVVAGIDRRHRLQVILPMEPGSPLPEVVDQLASHFLPREALLVVSNRTGETPADRPDDELVFEEMAGAARAYDIVLLDWWITSGTKAFSIAEFAPSGTGWQRMA